MKAEHQIFHNLDGTIIDHYQLDHLQEIFPTLFYLIIIPTFHLQNLVTITLLFTFLIFISLIFKLYWWIFLFIWEYILPFSSINLITIQPFHINDNKLISYVEI